MKNLFIGIFCLLALVACNEPKLKIACIGDSITSGYLLENIETESYPSVLQSLMGDTCQVKNFGFAQRTLLNKGDYPYINEKMYNDALNYNPDIAIIMLGSNDTSSENMKYSNEFVQDMSNMIRSFQNLKSHPKVYLCLPTSVYGDFSDRDSVFTQVINPYLREIAKECNVELIDLRTPTQNLELFTDGIHPNKEGAKIVAREVYNAITR